MGGDDEERDPLEPEAEEEPSKFEMVAQFESEAGVTCIEALDDGSDINEPIFLAGDEQGKLHVLIIEQVDVSVQTPGGGRIVAAKIDACNSVFVATETKVRRMDS